MRLDATLTRSVRHARKRYALALAHADAAETPKAQRKATRRAAAARRSQVEAMREADRWSDWAADA